MGEDRTGGCACGTVRYRLASEPFDAGWCHCRVCQRSSGSPALAFGTVPVDDLVWDAGEDALGSFASTPFGRRFFCGRCGTPLLIQVDHQPESVDFTLATLDDPGAVVPGFHLFYGARIAWAPAGDALPRHAGFRPDTRGLDGGRPPA